MSLSSECKRSGKRACVVSVKAPKNSTKKADVVIVDIGTRKVLAHKSIQLEANGWTEWERWRIARTVMRQMMKKWNAKVGPLSPTDWYNLIEQQKEKEQCEMHLK